MYCLRSAEDSLVFLSILPHKPCVCLEPLSLGPALFSLLPRMPRSLQWNMGHASHSGHGRYRVCTGHSRRSPVASLPQLPGNESCVAQGGSPAPGFLVGRTASRLGPAETSLPSWHRQMNPVTLPVCAPPPHLRLTVLSFFL